MAISYQSNNLIVTYLQVFLRDYCGLKIRTSVVIDTSTGDPVTVNEISRSSPVEVTGYYDLQTYESLALYMAYNYPEEGFPQKWTYDEEGKTWRSEDYKYLPLDDGSYPTEELLKMIKSNESYSLRDSKVIEIPERVLSYIFGEVVTPTSSKEEIQRVRKLLYRDQTKTSYVYDSKMVEDVKSLQKSFIDKFESAGQSLPDPFKEFKVTGYVDPWTEILLKEGVEN